MPSFDAVSEINHHEVTNAVDQANREVSNRFDLKDSNAKVTHDKECITINANESFHVDQVEKVLQTRLVARGIDLAVLSDGDATSSLGSAQKVYKLTEGIDTPTGKKINKMIKDAKIKAQSSIMDSKVRVTAKKIDDLRTIMDMLKEESFDMPLQFNNFRD
ncbi:YajQ family cyclic di-GMP-binding protein [Candidatus Synchoanobacter obligatus]|uniref:Nucleotide-binding protein MKS91_03945 n=1 Tax=Candidatus Synchoanobacter obligatus TaxID=2919597 RepID=A0ABT1L695_9GAMM|nr:YajQ family cyclic di-GMP-binding protein [Candidatus Synchoanobacter obligatus]MCP8352441.1 YajQ family cyclic di-GMP-binding protein [Candidatus Synchoanobacter obligatus]